jgi:hypothetical protein
MRYSLLLAFLLGGCLLPGSGDTQSAVAEGKDTADLSSCQLAASQIGKEGTTLEHGKRIVTFHNWIPKSGSSGEYVGFSLTVEGSNTVSYIVKESTSSYASTAKTWISPSGTSGSTAPAISNVQFCDCDCSCDGSGTGTGGGGGTSGPIL